LITDTPEGAILDITVIPRAGKTMIAGSRGGAILVRLAAAPVDGAANTALTTLLAGLLDIPKRQVVLLSGQASRNKRVKVVGISAAIVRQRLGL
jgi:uncharacterized protein (TIGR00251 family)